MRAIVVADDRRGSLSWDEVPTPQPGPGQVRIRVRATAINRADLLQRRGLYPVPPGASEILGLEAAGHIDLLGEGVAGWQVGDAVCVLLEGGGYAEHVVVDASMLLPVPSGLTVEQAAALPEVFYTAYLNLYMEGRLANGESALIHAGASGVGTAALQLCRAFGNPAYATASADKLDACRQWGATEAFDRTNDSFRERIRELRGRAGVDVILDMVGGGYLADNIDTVGVGGRIVLIGLMGGAKDEIPLNRLLMKRVSLIGSVLRSRGRADKEVITAELRERVWPLFETGALQPVIETSFPIEQVEQAHELIASNTTVGKVLLTIGD